MHAPVFPTCMLGRTVNLRLICKPSGRAMQLRPCICHLSETGIWYGSLAHDDPSRGLLFARADGIHTHANFECLSSEFLAGPQPREKTRLRLQSKDEQIDAQLTASVCVHGDMELYRWTTLWFPKLQPCRIYDYCSSLFFPRHDCQNAVPVAFKCLGSKIVYLTMDAFYCFRSPCCTQHGLYFAEKR